MEWHADPHGNLLLHSNHGNHYTLPYRQWGWYGTRPSDHDDDDGFVVLSPFEAFYLYTATNYSQLLPTTLPPATTSYIHSNPTRYTVYKLLRDRGWTVRAGTQYGGDFLLYRGAPGDDHAPFIVLAVESTEERCGVRASVVAGLVRAAAGARKKVVLVDVEGRVVILSRWVPEVERMNRPS
jgi:tRNA splicing endonuclease